MHILKNAVADTRCIQSNVVDLITSGKLLNSGGLRAKIQPTPLKVLQNAKLPTGGGWGNDDTAYAVTVLGAFSGVVAYPDAL